MKLSDLPKLEKPREKALHLGIEKLSNAELLGVILGTGSKEDSAIGLGYKIITCFGGIEKLPSLSMEKLMSINGIGLAKAVSILALCEFAKRVNYNSNILKPIKSVNTLYELFEPELANEPQEKCFILLLNSRNCIIKKILISEGTLTSHNIHTRDVFREAIKENCAKIIMMHNHPSGDSSPSQDDIETTIAISRFGRQIGIDLMDHIIIGKGNFYSLKSHKDY